MANAVPPGICIKFYIAFSSQKYKSRRGKREKYRREKSSCPSYGKRLSSKTDQGESAFVKRLNRFSVSAAFLLWTEMCVDRACGLVLSTTSWRFTSSFYYKSRAKLFWIKRFDDVVKMKGLSRFRWLVDKCLKCLRDNICDKNDFLLIIDYAEWLVFSNSEYKCYKNVLILIYMLQREFYKKKSSFYISHKRKIWNEYLNRNKVKFMSFFLTSIFLVM